MNNINWWQFILTTLTAIFIVDRFRRANSVKRMINFTFKSCSEITAFRADSKESQIQNFKFIVDCFCYIEKEFEETESIKNQMEFIKKIKMLHFWKINC